MLLKEREFDAQFNIDVSMIFNREQIIEMRDRRRRPQLAPIQQCEINSEESVDHKFIDKEKVIILNPCTDDGFEDPGERKVEILKNVKMGEVSVFEESKSASTQSSVIISERDNLI